jgi:hypothetical protein
MTKELPNPTSPVYKGVRDETDKIETIAATRGGAEALHALIALSNEVNTRTGEKTDITPYLDQLNKDQNGKFMTEIAAAYLKEKERPISHGKPMTAADVDSALGELDWRQEVDPVTKKLLECANGHFGDIAKAAGKDPNAGLTDADLGRAMASTDATAATDLKKTLTETDDAKMVQTFLADNGKLLDTIGTLRSKDSSSHRFQKSDLDAFLNHAHQNPGIYSTAWVNAAEQLSKELPKFVGKYGWINKDSMAAGLGINAESAGNVMEQALAKPIPTVPPAQPVEVAQTKPLKPREAPHTPRPHTPRTPAERTETADVKPNCKALQDALTIQDGEGPWACAVRLCEATKVKLNNKEILELALILKRSTPPNGGYYRTGEQLKLPEHFASSPNSNLAKLEAEILKANSTNV